MINFNAMTKELQKSAMLPLDMNISY